MDLAITYEFADRGVRDRPTADDANYSRDHYLAEVKLVKVFEYGA